MIEGVDLPVDATSTKWQKGRAPSANSNPGARKAADLVGAARSPGKFQRRRDPCRSRWKSCFRAVPPSLYLAMAMTEPEEKAEALSR